MREAAAAPPEPDVLAGVGARLRDLRGGRGQTLAALASVTGISVSTLSRLEAGSRRASLELLLPIARAHGVSLDDLVGLAPTPDPRVRATPVRRGARTIHPLTRTPGRLQAFKLRIDAVEDFTPRIHEGYEWLYVLSGRLRLVLGDHDLVLSTGEAAEFDTRTPHAFGCADADPVEVLSLFGPQGERLHLRARPAPTPRR